MSNVNNNLTTKILIALLVGGGLGIAIYNLNTDSMLAGDEIFGRFYELVVNNIAYVGGQIFVASLKVLVVPLVFVSLVCGVCSIGKGSRIGIISLKTLSLYIFTTFIAITIALFFATIFEPGSNNLNIQQGTFIPSKSPALTDVMINIIPSNIVDAMAKGNMLQVIVFAILFGIALSRSGHKTKLITDFFYQLDRVLMHLITILMQIAPYGIFCLVLGIFSKTGAENIVQLAGYFGTVIFVLMLHGFMVYAAILFFLGRVNPIPFYRKIQRLWLFSFSTASSNASIPVTLDVVETKLGVKNEIASFTVPLGATINMDGTAIMQGVATVFIAQYYDIEIGLVGYLTVIVTATLASIGAAGVPGVGLITLSLVLQQVGLPVEGIAMIIGVDRLLDMVRTAVNVTGDACVSVVASKSEDMLDEDIYYS